MIRPVADYGCVVYHSSINDDQDERLEHLQPGFEMCFFGPFISARKMRRLADLTTLREHRVILCDKFAKKSLTNPRFQHWFPVKTGRTSGGSIKGVEKYLEEK